MANHTLTLNYDGSVFKPDVDPLPVKQGDTVSFRLGTAPPNSKFKITMNEPGFFSSAVAHDTAPTITVRDALTHLTTYHCLLLDASNGIVTQSTETEPGGGMKPG